MSIEKTKTLAIACSSGSFKGAFAHGVLSALEAAGVRADGYAASSSSVIPTAWAAIGKATELRVNYWLGGMSLLNKPNVGMSKVVLGGIEHFSPDKRLFEPETPEYFIATSAVITPEAEAETQGEKARRLGKRLLVSAGKKDRSWVDKHLLLTIFGTKLEGALRLDSNNYAEVGYASCRMLHAWDIPAWINGKPYIDASYTCLCPAMAMVEAGYKEVIAISNEPGILYQDMFQLETISTNNKEVPIHIIQPDTDLKELGVNFTTATEEGLLAAYLHGEQKGKEFINR
jgi:hypothetical protein